jgi:MFS family permease
MVDAPAIERDHAIAHGATALVLMTVPQLVGSLLEGRLLLLAHSGDPRRWIAGGLAVLALATVLAALAPSPWLLAVAMSVAGAASGVACSLAQGALVEAEPHARERAMTRWTLAGALGDLAAPLLVALVGVAALGWRTAMLVAATLVGAIAIAVARARVGAIAADERDDEGPAGLRDLLRNRTLVAWLAGVTTCALLDEILVALAALHLRFDLGASEATTAFALGVWAAGCGVGLVVIERALARVEPRRLLVVGAIGCAVATLAWLAATSAAWAAVGLFAVGLTSAPLYPIAKAQAFAACPGRAALIGAAAQLFAPVEIALPWLLGALADATSLTVALAALVLEPLALLALALVVWPRPARPESARMSVSNAQAAPLPPTAPR